MGKDSGIEWTHHTFNPWWGCVKVSPACAHCYAETFDKRLGGKNWGADAERRTFSDKHWNEPLKWNEEAAKAGERHRVFCASMADVFENREDLDKPRARLFKLIEQTPNLDWLLLTKRPENILAMTFDAWSEIVPGHISQNPGDGRRWKYPSNVWVGTTVENPDTLRKRVQWLLRVPAKVRFLSCEPLLALLDPKLLEDVFKYGQFRTMADGNGAPSRDEDCWHNIDWVICGGESGAGSRRMEPSWARSLRDECVKAGVKFHFKQWGDIDEQGQRVGKKAAGRVLDGRTWDEYPALDPRCDTPDMLTTREREGGE